MRNSMKAVMLGLAICTASFQVSAHGPGDSHEPVTQQEAETLATSAVSQLIAAGKIDSSWKTIRVANAKQKDFNGSMEWVVTFRNESVSDAAKQTLYVFLTLTGEIVGANYTGQ